MVNVNNKYQLPLNCITNTKAHKQFNDPETKLSLQLELCKKKV